jgi:nucleoside-diphosphate kinase
MDQTFVMIKPDAWERGLVGEIISRFEKKGFRFVNMRVHCTTTQDAEELYAEHKGKDFYKRLIEFTAGAPVVVMIWARHNAVEEGRNIVKRIREEFSDWPPHRNCVHASDSREAFLREHVIFFPKPKIVAWD